MKAPLSLLLVAVLFVVLPQSSCSQETTIESTDLSAPASSVVKVLTWNIWMMPEILPTAFGGSPFNQRRAVAIADVLSEQQDVDIICLEKAFDKKARKIIARLRYGNTHTPMDPLTMGGLACASIVASGC